MIRSICLLAALLVALAQTVAAHEPTELLPDELGDWAALGDAELFRGDELFLYIDGGADIYLEYGFREVALRDYRRDDNVISVEVYSLDSDAYGLYSFMRGDEAEELALGDGGALAQYYLVFWSGRHYVAVTAQSEFEGCREALAGLGRALAEKLPAGGTVPPLMAALPAGQRRPGSEKHLVGPIALHNVSILAARLVSGWSECATARYLLPDGSEGALLLLRWTEEDAAAAALSEAASRAEGAGAADVAFDGDRLTVTGPRGENLRACTEGRIVIIAIGSGWENLEQLRRLATESLENCSGGPPWRIRLPSRVEARRYTLVGQTFLPVK